MEILAANDASRWCEDHGIGSPQPSSIFEPGFSSGTRTKFQIVIPASPPDRIALANALLVPSILETGLEEFQGGLFWMTDYDIWSETIERVGLQLLEMQFAPFRNDQPARLFTPDELVDAQIALGLTLLFEWDAFFAPELTNRVVFVSHHGYVEVHVQSDDDLRRWSAQFAKAYEVFHSESC